MAKKKKAYWITLGVILFLAYILLAAQPVVEELVVSSGWVSPLAAADGGAGGGEAGGGEADVSNAVPFQLGPWFGYVAPSGQYAFCKTREGYVSISRNLWAEYDRMPSAIAVKNPQGTTAYTLAAPPGYPVFFEDSAFIIGGDQCGVTALDQAGNPRWTYNLVSPLTCASAAGGFFLAGTLNGTMELINSEGKSVYTFEPSGSRIPIIVSCAISRDGTRLALISGIDEQRFLLLERSGDSYRVAYHEPLGEGFRRPAFLYFVDRDRRVVFERMEGLGVYDIESRSTATVNLKGRIYRVDPEGSADILFVITMEEDSRKNLVGIRYPGRVFMTAPFKSEDSFLGRYNSQLIIGGTSGLISFDIVKR